MNPRFRTHPNAPGFTLIELLVVISIIAILPDAGRTSGLNGWGMWYADLCFQNSELPGSGMFTCPGVADYEVLYLPRFSHRQRMSCSFFDGHVSSLTIADIAGNGPNENLWYGKN